MPEGPRSLAIAGTCVKRRLWERTIVARAAPTLTGSATGPQNGAPLAPPPRRRKTAWTIAKLAIGLGLLAYVAQRSPLHEIGQAFAEVRAVTIAIAFALYIVSMWIAGLRWRVLCTAYGAKFPIPVPRLVALYMQGLFYNTFLPGAIGGDLLRAHQIRAAFDTPLRSYAAVLLERVFGFAALACLSAVALTLGLSGQQTMNLAPLLAICGLAVAATVAGALMLPRILRRLHGAWGDRGKVGTVLGLLARTPDLSRPRLLVWAMLLSFGTQLVGVVAAYLITRDLSPQIHFQHCLLYIPLANIAAYFPMTVGGLGAREASFVALFARIGIPEARSFATSLVFFGVQVMVALLGGVLQFFVPMEPVSPGAVDEAGGAPPAA